MSYHLTHDDVEYHVSFHRPKGGEPHVHFHPEDGEGETLIVGIPDFGNALSESEAMDVLAYTLATGERIVHRDELTEWLQARQRSSSVST